jgi:hypothetical protein
MDGDERSDSSVDEVAYLYGATLMCFVSEGILTQGMGSPCKRHRG